MSVGEASLDDVDLVPADWPDAPAGAVLCGTGGTGDGLPASYEDAIPAGYTVGPIDTMGRPGLTGTAGAVAFVVEPRDGGVNLIFGTQG